MGEKLTDRLAKARAAKDIVGLILCHGSRAYRQSQPLRPVRINGSLVGQLAGRAALAREEGR